MARLSLRSLASLLFLCATVEGAAAHVHLKSASPAPNAIVRAAPEEVRISYSESVEPSLSAIKVIGLRGQVAAAGKTHGDPSAPTTLIVTLSKPVSPGGYEVRWRCVSKDTHMSRGAYRFEVRP